MFDNTKPNVILLSDFTAVLKMSKTLGIFKVAQILREHGIQVQVIHHLHTFSLSELKILLSRLISTQTLFVGVSNFYYYNISSIINLPDNKGVELKSADPGSILPHGNQFNQEIKNIILSKNSNCKFVLGGPTVREVDHNKIFDYLIAGYGETAIINLALHLQDSSIDLKKSRKSILGPIIIDDSRAEGYDFHTCNMKYEESDVILPGETLVLEVSRGCIFKCAFCSYPMNGKKKFDYIRNMDLIRKELIDNWKRFGVTRYRIADDTLNDSVEKCQMFAEMIATLPFKLEYWAYVRLDLLSAHPEMIDYLFGHGLKGAFFGIETLNQKTASAIGKGGDRRRQIATVKYIKEKYGNEVNLHGNFIYGLPHESKESLNSTSEWLLSDENPLDSWYISPLNIKPGNRGILTDFVSDIDKNYEKYGYRNLGYKPTVKNSSDTTFSLYEHGTVIWENDYTNRLELEDLCNSVQQHNNTKFSLSGSAAFDICSLGIDLELLLNKKMNEIDWYSIDKVKSQRAYEYKKKIFEHVGATMPNYEQWPDTFTEVLRQGLLLK